MKKIISLAIALCLMLTVCSTGLMSLTAAAAQTIEGSEVTWSFDNITKTLTFGGSGDIPDYDTYKDEAEELKAKLEEVGAEIEIK